MEEGREKERETEAESGSEGGIEIQYGSSGKGGKRRGRESENGRRR